MQCPGRRKTGDEHRAGQFTASNDVLAAFLLTFLYGFWVSFKSFRAES